MSEIYVELPDRRIPLKEIAESDTYPDNCHIIWNATQNGPHIIDGQTPIFSSKDKVLKFLSGYRTRDVVEPQRVGIFGLRDLLKNHSISEAILDPYFD